jgi:hypothetical protein
MPRAFITVHGTCAKCAYAVVSVPAQNATELETIYCSNPDCALHEPHPLLKDEMPDWLLIYKGPDNFLPVKVFPL